MMVLPGAAVVAEGTRTTAGAGCNNTGWDTLVVSVGKVQCITLKWSCFKLFHSKRKVLGGVQRFAVVTTVLTTTSTPSICVGAMEKAPLVTTTLIAALFNVVVITVPVGWLVATTLTG
jgi:hypothetical protein